MPTLALTQKQRETKLGSLGPPRLTPMVRRPAFHEATPTHGGLTMQYPFLTLLGIFSQSFIFLTIKTVSWEEISYRPAWEAPGIIS